MNECKICSVKLNNIRSLSKHIRDKHQCNSKTYYDLYILSGLTPTCVICGSREVSFVNISNGYKRTCSHKCGGILHRSMLAADETKHNNFRKKVSKNQSEIWEHRADSGEDKIIRKKIGNTISLIRAKMTDDERKEKFGWINDLSDAEREKWIAEVLLNTGCHMWWKTATEEEKKLVYTKRNATRIGVPLDEYTNKIPLSKESYYILVGIHTVNSYFRYKKVLDPDGIRGNNYHLDHKYSIIRGYYDGIAPEMIGSIHNLEIITAEENVRKGAKCSITKEYLMEQFNNAKI